MRVGLFSNTDGRTDGLASAIEVLCRREASLFIHCGDVEGCHVLDTLVGYDAGFVWGDRDYDRADLLHHAHSLQIRCFGLLGDLTLDGKRIAVLHGDDKQLLRTLVQEQQHDYLFCGEGLDVRDRRIGKTRLVFPGALHGGRRRTAALLDIPTGNLEFLAV